MKAPPRPLLLALLALALLKGRPPAAPAAEEPPPLLGTLPAPAPAPPPAPAPDAPAPGIPRDAAPAPEPAPPRADRPVAWHLADAQGVTWTGRDKAELERFVAARNAALTAPRRAGVYLVPPTCTTGACPRR